MCSAGHAGAPCHFWALQLPCHSDISSCFLFTCMTQSKCGQRPPFAPKTPLKPGGDSRVLSGAWGGDKANVNLGFSVYQATCLCAGVSPHGLVEGG